MKLTIPVTCRHQGRYQNLNNMEKNIEPERLNQSLKKASNILLLFIAEKSPLSLTDISERLSMPRTTVSSFIDTLLELKYLERDPYSSKYRLGPLLIQKRIEPGMVFGDRGNQYYFAYKEIVYISSHAKNTVIHTIDCDVTISKIIKDVEALVPEDIFVRIHRQFIININYILNVAHVVSGRYKVSLKCKNIELPIGGAYYNAFKDKLSSI